MDITFEQSAITTKRIDKQIAVNEYSFLNRSFEQKKTIENMFEKNQREDKLEKLKNYKQRFQLLQDDKKTQEAKILVKQLTEERKQREKRVHQKNVIQNLLEEQREQEEKHQEEIKKELEKQQRMIEAQKKIKEIERKKIIRENQELENNQKISIIKKQKVEEKFQNVYQNLYLKPEEKYIKEKKHIFQPLNPEELKKHEEWYEEQKKRKITQKQQQQQQLDQAYKYSPKRTKFLIKAIEEEQQMKENLQKREEAIANRIQLSKQYAELIKSQFKPRSLEHSQENNEKKFQNNQSQSLERKPRMIRYYLKKQKNDNFLNNEQNNQDSNQQTKSDLSLKVIPEIKMTSRSLEDPREKQNKKQLENPRKNQIAISQTQQSNEENNLNNPSFNKKNRQQSWIKHLNQPHSNLKEKVEILIQSTKRLENQAQIKENSSLFKPNPQTSEQINELYVQSIKAKLKLIDQIQSPDQNIVNQKDQK